MAVYRDQISEIAVTQQFREDVLRGLSSVPKYLPSKYFYDAEGDRLFCEIMKLPEYYLTRCEQEIFSMQTQQLSEGVLQRQTVFDVVELGAGDASKSIHLLRYLFVKNPRVIYQPIDISSNVIQTLGQKIPERIPGLSVFGLNGDYLEMLEESCRISDRPKLVLFLGSTIGNMPPAEALLFLNKLKHVLSQDDLVLIGFDLKKNPNDILAAYNDRTGITRAFNFNLLKRINKELQGNFKPGQFEHYPMYDPQSGACKSYLVSLEKQQVIIGGTRILFEQNEIIWMELSQKYSVQEIENMIAHAGFSCIQRFYDCRHWFTDVLLQPAAL
jgi:dimethylhistidine N-methyltransferase